jgi:hypothetical protein
MEFFRKITYALLAMAGAIRFVQPELRDALFIPTDNRENFKQVIAKRSDLVQIDGARLAPSTFGTYLYAGTVLGLASSGGDAGFWKPYAVGNSDGSQVAAGVLSEDANVDASGNGSEAVIIKEGTLFQSLLVGLDSNAITNLGGKPFVDHGVNLIRIRA